MKRLLSAVLVAALLCTGCASRVPPETTEAAPVTYEYTEVYRRISEPYASGFVLQENMRQAVVGGRCYEFEASIPEDRCDAFITGQEALCALLEGQGLSTEGLTFRILLDYTNWTDSENGTASFGLHTAGTWAQALTTLQAVFGDYSNYGYLYALADHVAEALGWVRDETGDATATPFRADSSLLNLVYPCFDSAYTGAEDIAACKALSKALLAETEDVWSEAAFLQARLDWARSQGIDFEATELTFAYYSESCPLKFRTKYLEVFKDATYGQDFYVTAGYITEDYFVSTGKIIQTFQWLDEQLISLREIFGATGAELVPVQLRGDTGGEGALRYRGLFSAKGDAGSIQTKNIHCLAHEYVHYLFWRAGGTEDPAYEQWLNEVVAHYYAVAEHYETYLLIGANADPGRIGDIEALIGEDYNEPADYIKFTRAIARKRGDQPYPYYLETDPLLCPAFGDYFVRTYGEETFLACMLAPSTARARTGKTIDEIVDDFCLDMDALEKG